MCLQKVTNYACGHNKLDDRDRCAAAIREQGSAAAAFFLGVACPNHEFKQSSLNHGCGFGRIYCGSTPEGRAVDQAYNKRAIISQDIASLNAQIDGLSQDLQWRGLQLRMAADAYKQSHGADCSTMPSVGRDAEFLHTKAVGVPFIQERSTLIEQYWTLTTFIESCEGHWWQKLNQQRMILQARQRLAAATEVTSATRLPNMKQQQSSSSSILLKSTEIPRRKDSAVYPDTRAVPSNSSPTTIQKSGRKRRQPHGTIEAHQPPQRKRKLGDRPNSSRVDVSNDNILDDDTDLVTGVRRSGRTLDKKVNYSQISSSQSLSREPTPVQASEPDSAFSPPRSTASDASTILPESAQAFTFGKVDDKRRACSHRDAGATTRGLGKDRSDRMRTGQDSSSRTTAKNREHDHTGSNATHLTFGQTHTERPMVADHKSTDAAIDSSRPVLPGVRTSHSQPTQESFVNTRATLHSDVESDVFPTPEPAKLGVLVKLKVPPSVLAAQNLQSESSQRVMKQGEAVAPSRARNADNFEPSPLIVPTSEELMVTPVPYSTTPAVEVALQFHAAGFTPDAALFFDPGTIDDESFHFNSASFSGDDDGLSYNMDGVVEPDFDSANMDFDDTHISHHMQANPFSVIGTRSVEHNASVPSSLHHSAEQPLPEESKLRADNPEANNYGDSDSSALSDIDWALHYEQ